MGKKAAATPEPPEEEETVEEPEPPPLQLQGDFIFPDGSEYSGQYLKKKESVCLHGDGHFTSGPEIFQGTFEEGCYKQGTYKSCNGSTYTGNFYNGVFHGPGEYAWPDGRIYRGMWKDGRMHGRGQYENFSFGINKLVEGFSIRGSFLSSVRGQEEARQTFVEEYATEYKGSAKAALRDILARMEAAAKALEPVDPKKGAAPPPAAAAVPVPKEYVVPVPPPAGETEEPQSADERARVERVVVGPFPDPANLTLAKLKAFQEAFLDGAAQPGVVGVCESKETCEHLDGGRLKLEQLSHVGQAVELCHAQAEGGNIRVLVFVNCATDYDISRAQWKVVFCDEVPMPEEPPENAKDAKKK